LKIENQFHPEQLSPIPLNLRQFITEKLNDRWILIYTRIHIASFLLDPRFRHIPSSPDGSLAEEQFLSAEQFLKEYEFNGNWDTIRSSWIKFRNREGCFSEVSNAMHCNLL